MGRRKKCEQIKRTNNVMVRFTDAEYASISISAEQAGYPVAVYVRKSALDERIEVHYNITAELPELQKLIAEYSAIGNNLNQIAQYFHSGGFYSKSMQDEINRHLTALWQLRQEAIKLPKERLRHHPPQTEQLPRYISWFPSVSAAQTLP